MRHLNDTVNESLLKKPIVEDGKVKVLILSCDETACDNLNLMRGMNKVCVVWTAEGGKGYMCANGGTAWNDGQQWTNVAIVRKLLGNPDLKTVDDVKLSYAFWSTVGEPKYYNIKVMSAEVDAKVMEKFYRMDHKSLLIYERGCSTAAVSACFKKWRKEGWLSENK